MRTNRVTAIALSALSSCGLVTAGIQGDVGGLDAFGGTDASIAVDSVSDLENDGGAVGDALTTSDGSSCPVGMTACGNECVQTASDPIHCGNCTTSCSGGDASCAATVCSATLRIRGFIDATSQLVIQGSAAHWFNDSTGAAPGLWMEPPIQPTYLDDVAWTPTWPDAGENRSCACASSSKLVTPLASKPQAIRVTLVSGRGSVTIGQQPSVANGFTAIVEFTDAAGGAAWYEVLLGYDTN